MIVEIAGWIGGALVLASFACVSLGRIAPRTFVNQAVNIVGAAGLSWNAFVHAAWPLMALDVVWALVGVVTIVGLSRAGR